jgi:hypothetical protein
MTFSISEFTSQINRVGLAQSNLFVVRITLPNALSILEEGAVNTRTLTFLCRSVELPEISIGTTEFRPRGFGPSERRPTLFEYSLMPTVFMVDSSFGVLNFFHRWMQAIVNYDVEAGYQSSNPSSATLPYEFGYKDEYAATIEIIVYSGPSEDRFYTYKFGNAYPTTVGSITTAWENSAEVMALPVTFTYDELKVDGTQTGVVTAQRSSGNGILGYLSSLNTYGQAISGIQLPNNIQDLVNTFTDVSTILGSLR